MKYLIAILLGIVTSHSQTNQYTSRLQAGLMEEEVNRNLPAAVMIYSNIVAQADVERPAIANAIFRLGESYRKLGQTNEAVSAYRKLLRDFSDQASLAALARTNLMNLGVVLGSSNAVLDNEKDEIEDLKRLLKQSPDLVLNGNILYEAVDNGKLKVAEFLLASGVPPNGTSRNSLAPLHIAAFRGNVQMVELLLKSGAEVNQFSRSGSFSSRYNVRGVDGDLIGTPLHLASRGGHLSVSRLLIERGANPNSLDNSKATPLHRAAEAGHGLLCKLLLSHGANTEAKTYSGETPLGAAIRARMEFTTKLLLENGAKLDDTTAGGMNPIAFAALLPDPKILEILLSYKPVLNKINEPEPVLRSLAFGNRTNEIMILIRAGADPNTKGKDGATALHAALVASRNNAAAIRLLLDHKADPNIQDGVGNTPLHYAVAQQINEIIETLMDHGANPDVQNKNGLTPLDFATQRMAVLKAQLREGRIQFEARLGTSSISTNVFEKMRVLAGKKQVESEP